MRFLRQRPLGEYILDFYAAALHLAVEVDGSQHLAAGGRARDQRRDAWLRSQGIRVLRFDDRQVLLETDGVVEVILRAVAAGLRENPLGRCS